MTLGVVIPAHDEAATIGPCLDSLEPFRQADDPLLVVDDASTDGTGELAVSRGVRVVRRERPSRGRAVARGYRELRDRAPAILVAHADMRFPADARRRIAEALERHPDAVGGWLGHRIDDPRRRFRWVEAGNRLRARRWQLPYGDQAQFFRVEAVERGGGFPDVGLCEDLELSLRLRRLGRWLHVDAPVTIPARHWRSGVVLSTLVNWGRALAYRARR